MLIDGAGGVGHSPAATAAWLKAAAGRPDLANAREVAQRYLVEAAAATNEYTGSRANDLANCPV
jgi:hypothetical protein